MQEVHRPPCSCTMYAALSNGGYPIQSWWWGGVAWVPPPHHPDLVRWVPWVPPPHHPDLVGGTGVPLPTIQTWLGYPGYPSPSSRPGRGGTSHHLDLGWGADAGSKKIPSAKCEVLCGMWNGLSVTLRASDRVYS